MSFGYTEHFIFTILHHSNKISQPVRKGTYPWDIVIHGTGPGFRRSVWEADEQSRAHIPALRCPQVSARDHFESSWMKTRLCSWHLEEFENKSIISSLRPHGKHQINLLSRALHSLILKIQDNFTSLRDLFLHWKIFSLCFLPNILNLGHLKVLFPTMVLHFALMVIADGLGALVLCFNILDE